eukprot:4882314-Pyramimonas_sp.AAC.1
MPEERRGASKTIDQRAVAQHTAKPRTTRCTRSSSPGPTRRQRCPPSSVQWEQQGRQSPSTGPRQDLAWRSRTSHPRRVFQLARRCLTSKIGLA